MTATVATRSSTVETMAADWSLASTLMAGTRAMRAAGELYLPKFPAEEDEQWRCRLAASVLFPAFSRTVVTLAAKPFSKPITVENDVPSRFAPWLDDIDLQGRKLDMFASDLLVEALGPGLAGILVEYPRADGLRTQADERRAGLRPYWIQIRHDQIIGWRAERRDGTWRLTQLRFFEGIEEPDGAWGVTEVQQVRVLQPGSWETHRKNAKGEWILHESGTTSIAVIPFVPVYGQRLGFMQGRSPLIELAHLNVKHWQSQSDQDNILHTARVPILAAIGVDNDFPFKVGASSAVRLPTGGDMKFVEHTGASIAAGRLALEDLKEEMRQAGAELLVLQPGKKTATQVGAEESVGMCALSKIAESLEDALDLALQFTAEWVGEQSGGHVTLFKDFGVSNLAEASAQLVLAMASAGRLSDETLRSEMRRRGVLSPDVVDAEEAARIAAQPPRQTTPT